MEREGRSMPNDLCFVLMPFGKKPDVSGTLVDFDAVYHELIAPAIREAGLDPIRADEEMTGGIIHKPMFERLIFCKFAVADLTTANANVFYELGLRHAVRPWSTVLIFAKGGSQLPFDVSLLRALPYTLNAAGTPDGITAAKEALMKRLADAREAAAKEPATDSPIYQLVDGYPEIDHTKTDVFRDRVQYSEELKKKLAAARKQGADALRGIEAEIGDLAAVESGVVIDLYLSYRGAKAWDDMIRLAETIPKPLAATVMVREQKAFALNRAGRSEEAEVVLKELLDQRGPSSETYGLLGRVYKDRWEAAVKAGKTFPARGLLDKAIDAYLKGFEADWRDAYPGINTVTLMELKEPPDPRRLDLIPVVTYAVERRIAGGTPDYWDHATRLELAVLGKNEDKAAQALGDALANVRETWEPETTLRNIRLIREAREKRGDAIDFEKQVEEELAAAGK
jgi:tetratricopeptide (TPR) repeat protein